MALTINTEDGGAGPVLMYFVNGDTASNLKLVVTSVDPVPQFLDWTLKNQAGDPVQANTDRLQVNAGKVDVPVLPTEAGQLTLTLVDSADTTNSGTIAITAAQLEQFTLSPITPENPRLGQSIAITAEILDSNHESAGGVTLEWMTDSPRNGDIIPPGKEKQLTDKKDPTTFELKTANIQQGELDQDGGFTVYAKLGDFGNLRFRRADFLPDKKTLKAPESVLPLPNNTIDDATIAAVRAGNGAGIPFRILRVEDAAEGDMIYFYCQYSTPVSSASLTVQWVVKDQNWPLVLKAPVDGGAFDFTGSLVMQYQVFNPLGELKGTSDPLNLQVRRKEFPKPYPEDATLPRPWPVLSSYSKKDFDEGSDLVVQIPLWLDSTLPPIFQAGDQITVKLFLTGYTTANENQIVRIASDVHPLTPDELDPAKKFFTVRVKHDNFEDIEGSLANVSYELLRKGEQVRTSPSRPMAVDTVSAYSSRSRVETMGAILRAFQSRR